MMHKTVSTLTLVGIFALLTSARSEEALRPHLDHGGPEFPSPAPVETPIQHEKYFHGERELFGYRPRYFPGVISFDRDNRPYIDGRWYLQTLGDAGTWTTLDVSRQVRNLYPDAEGYVAFLDHHVSFDRDGDLYALTRIIRAGTFRYGLLHSSNRGRSWSFYETPVPLERLERLEAHNQLDGPPPMVTGRGGELRLVIAKKTPRGSLEIGRNIVIADADGSVSGKGKNWITPAHSGGGNVTATFDGKTHIVWLSIEPHSYHATAANKLPTKPEDGYKPYASRYKLESLAPCYAITYDHATDSLSERTLLGFTRRDTHNGPAISVDSCGNLHVVIGAHHDNFLYTRSLASNRTTGGWTTAEPFGVPLPKNGTGSYTYTGLVCDSSDTLHLVSRWAGSGYYFRLVYHRKKTAASWEPHKDLVIPFRTGYSVWYHHLNIDRLGRLFVDYSYMAAELNQVERAAYQRKWPQHDYRRDSTGEHGLFRHDHCMLISDDGGNTWRLARTEDFVAGIAPSAGS